MPSSLAYKQHAPLSIGETIAEQRERERAEEAAVIQAVRTFIWSTRYACQLCRGRRKGSCLGPDQMHEDPSRAQTRGLPPAQRFNPRVCGRLCERCHNDVTENRIRIVFADPELRFMGAVSSEVV